jgi:glyoxylase-like metal-dependent hydrolase (beta-lactamase superfamily II)
MVLAKGLLGESTPRPVGSVQEVRDGELVVGEFEVMETPGHTMGHVSYYWRRRQILFTGDALAVVGGRVSLMSRPVTPDLERARESARRLLGVDSDVICPGHRRPLVEGVAWQREKGIEFLDSGKPWPLLGTLPSRR